MKYDIIFIQTCGACPEQYDAMIGDTIVGYLRLRRGNFTVRCPDSSGDVVYSASPRGDGIFESDEREFYLDEAKNMISKFLDGDSNKEAEIDRDIEIAHIEKYLDLDQDSYAVRAIKRLRKKLGVEKE